MPLGIQKVHVVDQTTGQPFKSACDADWREIVGADYCPSHGIEPCGFVAMVTASEPVPTTAAELEALERRLSDLDYMRPRVRAMMERVAAARLAYFVGPLADKYIKESNEDDGTHAIGGMVGQWEVAAEVRGGLGESGDVHFLRNIKVGTWTDLGGYIQLDPTEADFWTGCVAEGGLDSGNVRAWMAEERPFRSADGSTPHFVQRGVSLESLEEWAVSAGTQLHNGGIKLILDFQAHYCTFMATAIDGVPTILSLDSVNADFDATGVGTNPCLDTLQAVLGGPAACARLLDHLRSAVQTAVQSSTAE